MQRCKKLTGILVTAGMLFAMLPVSGVATTSGDTTATSMIAGETDGSGKYATYLDKYNFAPNATADLEFTASQWLSDQSRFAEIADETVCDKTVWKIGRDGYITFEFTNDTEGLYTLLLPYKVISEGVMDGKVTAHLDGALTFAEAAEQELPRLWKNSSEIRQDSTGNDIRPEMEEVDEWQIHTWRDPIGKQEKPLCFYLSAGSHRLTLYIGEVDLLMRAPILGAPIDLQSYEEYCRRYADVAVYNGEPILIEAEDTFQTSSRSLIAANDMSSPLTTPYDAYYIRLNTLSGNNWRYMYDRATWKVVVPETGMYRLSFRFMQNYYNGMDTHRSVYINGEIPFEEVASVGFKYSTDWQSKEAGDYYYYLTKGENTISMEVVLGKYSEILQRVEELTPQLNRLYRRIIMVTGTTPDVYRDYNLDKEIPGMMESFEQIQKDINVLIQRVRELTGVKRSSELSTLEQLSVQISDILESPSSLTKGSRLSRFSSNIGSLGAWINKLREQPLLLDSLTLLGKDDPVPAAQASFWKHLQHTWNRFWASFVMDYSRLGEGRDDVPSIRVWVFTGRDQAQLLKDMVDSGFSSEKNVQTTIELVSGGLIEAMLAGKGPDVVLGRGESEPVDYAMRNAVLDLSTFDDFEEVAGWFEEGTMRSFRYNGGYYALPETQDFNMLFCRMDVLEELGLEVPKTWDQLIREILPVLQQYNMSAGIGGLMAISDNTIFTTLLYQMGGKLYADDLMTASLDTQVAYDAFAKAVEMYRDYQFPTEYDFMNRFRTGEMPLAVAPYTSFNSLKVAAPEISGLWEMFELPGLLQEDGTILNTQVMASTGAVINVHTEEPEASWEFLKWWVSADTQMQFGNSIEAILGSGGRYATANKEALRGLPWGSEQLKQLESQRSKNTVLPQIPGSYFTKRAVYNALCSTVLSNQIPREQLLYWNEEINMELARKRLEFSFMPQKEGEQ